jgi:hypothetical protein
MHLDAAAGIWQCSGDGTIFHLPCEGLDPRGNPIYRRASEVSYPYPPEFTGDRLRRLFYVPGDDVMIAGGSPGTEENACNLLIRFDHWSDPARRTKRWTIHLPLNDNSYTPDTGYGGGAPVAMQACGKYLFVAYGYGLIRACTGSVYGVSPLIYKLSDRQLRFQDSECYEKGTEMLSPTPAAGLDLSSRSKRSPCRAMARS